MAAWFWYAVVAAVLYGAHQIFTKLAADHIGEGLGGFVVEATAALSILVYLAFLWLASRWNQQSSAQGIFYSVLTGICVGAGTIAFFLRFQNRSREQLSIDLRRGIGPDDAATIALYSNPALRAIRDRRGLAAAQLIQAGILPNPVVSYARDFVTGGSTAGTRDGYTFSAGWEFSALIPFLPKQTAARKNFQSVDLDVAWQEWQIAVNARTAVYRVLGLDAPVGRARA